MFEPDLSALVRETLQNSNDQLAEGSKRVTVTLRADRIEGERLQRLRRWFDWSTLLDHVAAVEVAKGRFERGLELMRGDALPGLWIEDRGTTGLVGEETGSGNFAALCRDRLFSEKQRAEAGGSFGLGKAVLWRFSSVSTIAFYSRIAEGPDAGRERFIVKASLPFHDMGKAGPSTPGTGGSDASNRSGAASGRFRCGTRQRGKPPHRSSAPGRWAEDETGTSIFVVGFDDPATED